MNCDYCTTNGDYLLTCRMLNESKKREEIARKIIQDQRKGIVTEDLVEKILEAHKQVFKKKPLVRGKKEIIRLILEELKK